MAERASERRARADANFTESNCRELWLDAFNDSLHWWEDALGSDESAARRARRTKGGVAEDGVAQTDALSGHEMSEG